MDLRSVRRKLALGLIGLLVLTGCSSGDIPGYSDEVSAYVVCKRGVRAELEAPATTDWPTLSDSMWTKHDDTYELSGYVDVEFTNSSGPERRLTWTCTARTIDRGESWSVRATVSEQSQAAVVDG
jgi:hypothetical protein